jgi:2-hydroxy-3-keto-5-methylthiopentenyl-1-phosphate phosphatase
MASITRAVRGGGVGSRAGGRDRPGLPAFRALVRGRSACRSPILSAGFSEIIDLLLVPAELPGVEVRANRFEPGPGGPVFRTRHALGHDKSVTIAEAKRRGHRTVFVGDGLSDREPAAVADLVFARRGRSLVDYCRKQGIACEQFETFFEVRQSLEARLRSVA